MFQRQVLTDTPQLEFGLVLCSTVGINSLTRHPLGPSIIFTYLASKSWIRFISSLTSARDFRAYKSLMVSWWAFHFSAGIAWRFGAIADDQSCSLVAGHRVNEWEIKVLFVPGTWYLLCRHPVNIEFEGEESIRQKMQAAVQDSRQVGRLTYIKSLSTIGITPSGFVQVLAAHPAQ